LIIWWFRDEACRCVTFINPHNTTSIMNSEKTILQKLEKIEKEIEDIREHMVDIDSIMTEDDYLALLEYRKEKEAGKLVSHEQLKKELGI